MRFTLFLLLALAATISAARATTAVDGSRVVFTVTAKGTQPFTYQWRKNGAAISGATAASYVIAAAKPADSGTYSVTVTNAAGTATSRDVVVNVTAAAPSGVVVSVEVSTAPAGGVAQ